MRYAARQTLFLIPLESAQSVMTLERSVPHRHVAAVSDVARAGVASRNCFVDLITFYYILKICLNSIT
jgi:hypothetical protein